MIKTRVIPCLLLNGKGFVKTEAFKDPRYLGDPLNIVKIFNEKEAHEIVILDIRASIEGRGPNIPFLSEIAGEGFMPMAYGGGVRSTKDIHDILSVGFEKVILNTIFAEQPDIIYESSQIFGSQSIVVSIDVKKTLRGNYEVFTKSGQQRIKQNPIDYAIKAEECGAGEILLNSIDRDGTMKGYDIPLIKSVTQSVNIPVLACGGAGNLLHLKEAIFQGGASAVVAGSLFVFHGKHRAVLINFPEDMQLKMYLD